MAGFNFIDAAAAGYQFAWRERRTLWAVGMAPLLFKMSSFVLVTAFASQETHLRQGLMLVPAYFLEGWLVTYAIRLAIFGERWHEAPSPINYRPAGAYKPGLHSRKRALMAGTVVYLLTNLCVTFAAAFAWDTADMKQAAQNQPEPAAAGAFFAVIIALTMGIWAFRFLWLYVPAALDCPLPLFFRKIESFFTSFYMIGLWLMAMVPLSLCLILGAEILLVFFPNAAPESPPALYLYMVAALQAALEMLIAVIAGVGMAYGIRDILTGDNRKNKLV